MQTNDDRLLDPHVPDADRGHNGPAVEQPPVPAAEAFVAELKRQIASMETEAREEGLRCYGKVRGKGPEYFEGFGDALDLIKTWVITMPIEQTRGGNAGGEA